MQTKHVPEQQVDPNNSSSTDHTTWAYNTDETIRSVTDARGASATYIYNTYRHLVNEIHYSAPSGIATTSNVAFDYDAAGNRRWMTDGSGRVDYSYDQLSRVQSETRQFNGLSGSFAFSYLYNLVGEVTSVTDEHANVTLTNSFDSIGRVTGANAESSGTNTNFVSNLQYRAWGASKSVSYGNSDTVTFNYDSRTRVAGYAFSGLQSPIAATYQYYSDSSVKFAQDQSTTNSKRDRAYQVDHAGRLIEAYSGSEARNFVNNIGGGTADGPYRQSETLDAWNNLSTSTDRFWTRTENSTETYNQSSNRNVHWSYDADGNILSRNEVPNVNGLTPATYTFDAAGRDVSVTETRNFTEYFAGGRGLVINVFTNSQTYDGDGEATRYERDFVQNGSVVTGFPVVAYYLRSTVLGGRTISEYGAQGQLNTNYAYAGNERVGEFQPNYNHTALYTSCRFADPVTGDDRAMGTNDNGLWGELLDPNGVD